MCRDQLRRYCIFVHMLADMRAFGTTTSFQSLMDFEIRTGKPCARQPMQIEVQVRAVTPIMQTLLYNRKINIFFYSSATYSIHR
jgi:hypothetical protein